MPVMTVEQLAEKCESAYSTGRYREGWAPCIRMLRKEFLLDDRQIEAVIRSKWTRWAADMHDAPYGHVPARALRDFMRKQENLTAGIADLVEQTF
jgi:exonuclease V gamma subunit